MSHKPSNNAPPGNSDVSLTVGGRESSNPCGPRDVLRLALPLIISTASMTIMNFVDRVFLMSHSQLEFAAAMPSSMVHFTLLCFPLGLAAYVNVFVAQYHGAGQPGRIGAAVWQGVRIGMYCTPLFMLTIPMAPYAFALIGHSADVMAYEIIYFQVLTLSSGAAIIGAAMSAFYTGRGKTGTVMFVDVVANSLNIVLDYALIFGCWGLPEMGIAGAAWATVFSQWLKVAIYWYLMSNKEHRRTFCFDTGRKVDMDLLRRLCRHGGASGLQLVVEMGSITLFLLLVGRLGNDAMAATNLAFNVNTVAFLPMMGMGLAVSTMVGQQLGRNRADLAAKATWTAVRMTAIYAGTLAIMYAAVPDLFLLAHAWGVNAVEFDRLREPTIVLLRFVAVFCLFDMLQIMFSSAIKGAGDTRFILLTTIIVSPIPVIAGWVGIRWFGGGLVWCWLVITLWITSLGIIYYLRFLQGRWRTMRVIGPDLLADDTAASSPESNGYAVDADDQRIPRAEVVVETHAVDPPVDSTADSPATDPTVA